MPYANRRPSLPDELVELAWERAKDENGEVWVLDRDGREVRIRWEPGQSRKGVWDMGHRRGAEYRKLREECLGHNITLDEFLERYKTVVNYEVQHPGRNRSRVDESS